MDEPKIETERVVERAGRQCMGFCVPLEKAKKTDVQTYLGPGKTPVDDVGDALWFYLFVSPSVLERHKIERATAEFAGGMRDLAALRAAVDRTGDALREPLLAIVLAGMGFGDDWRDTCTPEQKVEVSAGVAALLEADASDLKQHWSSMSGSINMLSLMAEWDVLCQAAPLGWARIADVELGDKLFWTLWAAYHRARDLAEQGNVPPSAN